MRRPSSLGSRRSNDDDAPGPRRARGRGLHADVDRELIAFDHMPRSLRSGGRRRGGRRLLPARRPRSGRDRPGDVDERHHRLAQPGGIDDHAAVREERAHGAERSIGRKVREAILAVKLEHTTSKREILEGYLNTVYFGHGAYGVQAAARTYFDRDARADALLQSATLAGLIAAPSARDPFVHPEAATRGRRRSHGSWRSWLERERARRSTRDRWGARRGAVVSSEAPHFMEHVRRLLAASYGLDTSTAAASASGRPWTATGSARPSARSRRAPSGPIRRRRSSRSIRGPARSARWSGARTSTPASSTSPRRAVGRRAAPSSRSCSSRRWSRDLAARGPNGPSSLTIQDPFCETRGEPWTVSNAGDQWAGTMSLEQAMAGIGEHDLRPGHGRGGAGGRRRRGPPDGDPAPACRPCARSGSGPPRSPPWR